MLRPPHSLATAVPLVCGLVSILVSPLAAAGESAASHVRAVVQDVQVAEASDKRFQPAGVGQSLDGIAVIRTGAFSRADLALEEGKVTRLGADTLYEARAGWRKLVLTRGTVLVQTPWSWRGSKLKVGGFTVAWQRATALIEHMPGHHVKVLVLEGDVRFSIDARLGESTVVMPGKMLMMAVNEVQIPKTVAVDLATIVKTSALIDPVRFQAGAKPAIRPLPSMSLIQKQVALQAAGKRKERIAETNLLIAGEGTDVIIASKEVMAALHGEPGAVPTAAVAPVAGRAESAQFAAKIPALEPALPEHGEASESPSEPIAPVLSASSQ